jgi:hypothetical protein
MNQQPFVALNLKKTSTFNSPFGDLGEQKTLA